MDQVQLVKKKNLFFFYMQIYLYELLVNTILQRSTSAHYYKIDLHNALKTNLHFLAKEIRNNDRRKQINNLSRKFVVSKGLVVFEHMNLGFYRTALQAHTLLIEREFHCEKQLRREILPSMKYKHNMHQLHLHYVAYHIPIAALTHTTRHL